MNILQMGLLLIGSIVGIFVSPLIYAAPKFLVRAFMSRWFLNSYGVGYGKKIEIGSPPWGIVYFLLIIAGAIVLFGWFIVSIIEKGYQIGEGILSSSLHSGLLSML